MVWFKSPPKRGKQERDFFLFGKGVLAGGCWYLPMCHEVRVKGVVGLKPPCQKRNHHQRDFALDTTVTGRPECRLCFETNVLIGWRLPDVT